MFVTNGQESSRTRGILSLMPSALRKYMYRINFDQAMEIRMSLGKPLMIYYNDGCFYLNSAAVLTKSKTGSVKVTRAIIEEALEIASKSSLYTKEQCIKKGYITTNGGHRIGIAGTAVFDGEKISFLKDISCLNYRLASEERGVAKDVLPHICDGGDTKNTMIISPPCGGKTTMLRDIVRSLSDEGHRISVVDERSEIGAMCDGISSFDLGEGADVLDAVPKAEGMEMALRSLSPQIIAVDELGGDKDATSVKNCINSGVKIICTAHGKSIEEIKKRTNIKECLEFFEVFIILSRDTKTGAFLWSVEKRTGL